MKLNMFDIQRIFINKGSYKNIILLRAEGISTTYAIKESSKKFILLTKVVVI